MLTIVVLRPPLLLLLLRCASAALLQAPPGLTLSSACAIEASALDELRRAEVAVVRLDAPLQFSEAPEIPALGAAALRGRWVHCGTTIKELAAARKMGGATVWLNEQATTLGDVDSQGYLGASIIEEFADALCGRPEELASAAIEAHDAYKAKTQAEERRESQEWDAEAAEAAADVEAAADAVEPPVEAAAPAAAPAATEPAAATATATKFCIMCGTKLPAVARFCSSCGERQISVT